ncbi:helix-turn-helix protein [compost metagenome]
MSDIAKQIKRLMKENKITRLKLSNDTGIPYTTLTQIINGRTKNPQVRALETIAEYFQVSMDYLLGKSITAVIENRLAELNMTVEHLAEITELPAGFLRGLDSWPTDPIDYEQGEIIDKLSKSLGLDFNTLASAYSRQEQPTYSGPAITPEEAFADTEEEFENEGLDETIAAHHDGEDWTEEELEEIKRFKEFVKMKRGHRTGE